MKSEIDISDPSKEKSKKLERNIRFIFVVLFALCFMVSVGYLLYTIYEIYYTDLSSLGDVLEVWDYMGDNIVAFEASILSFMLFVMALKI